MRVAILPILSRSVQFETNMQALMVSFQYRDFPPVTVCTWSFLSWVELVVCTLRTSCGAIYIGVTGAARWNKRWFTKDLMALR